MDRLTPPFKHRGVTLIEVMVVVAIVGILAGIAYPNYIEFVRRGRRSDAMSALSAVLHAQEQWRAHAATYSVDLQALGLHDTSADGHYTLSLSGASRSGYTATATAVGQQAGDAACKTLSLTLDTRGVHHGATGGASARRCWGLE